MISTFSSVQICDKGFVELLIFMQQFETKHQYIIDCIYPKLVINIECYSYQS